MITIKKNLKHYERKLLRTAIDVVLVGLLVGCISDPTLTTKLGFPVTSASAITSPPSIMDDINTHIYIKGTGADPNVITLGPKVGGRSGWKPYPNKTSMEFELEHGAPVLTPIDMVLISFDNRSANYQIGAEGERMTPFNDLELCFEVVNPDWSEMIVCTYHLVSSPLLLGHNLNPDCSEVERWKGTFQAQGHLFFEFDDYVVTKNSAAGPCDALIGRLVDRGELIGYAGSVGTHSMASFRFKVPYSSKNPLVQQGNRHLHWVQPGSFFYWKCYTPDVVFPRGVLAYPFECGGYQLLAEMRDFNFKYSVKE